MTVGCLLLSRVSRADADLLPPGSTYVKHWSFQQHHCCCSHIEVLSNCRVPVLSYTTERTRRPKPTAITVPITPVHTRCHPPTPDTKSSHDTPLTGEARKQGELSVAMAYLCRWPNAMQREARPRPSGCFARGRSICVGVQGCCGTGAFSGGRCAEFETPNSRCRPHSQASWPGYREATRARHERAAFTRGFHARLSRL